MRLMSRIVLSVLSIISGNNDAKANWSWPSLQEGLIKLDAQLCPHMRTSYPGFYKRLVEYVKETRPLEQDMFVEGDYQWPTWILRWTDRLGPIHCTHPGCRTKFIIRTFLGRKRIRIFLTGIRDVSFDTVRGQRWLAATGADLVN